MRVVCAYAPARLRRGTIDALVDQSPSCEFVDVSGAQDAYWSLFRDLWRAGEDFMLVEHDILIAPGTVEAFTRCPEPWCAAPGGIDVARKMARRRTSRDHVEAYLQCNRWRAAAMAAHPDAADIAEHDWRRMDGQLLSSLRERVAVHSHHELATLHLSPGLGWSQFPR